MEYYTEQMEELDKTIKCGFRKDERDRIPGDTKEIQLKDENVLLLDNLFYSPVTSAVNTAITQSLRYTPSIAKENKPVTETHGYFKTLVHKVTSFFPSFPEKYPTKQPSVSGNLKINNSKSCYATTERRSVADINVDPNDSEISNFKASNAKKLQTKGKFNPKLSEETIIEPDFDDHEMCNNDEVKTLEDALRHFGLYSYLEELDNSIEKLRRHGITEDEHEETFKKIDKEIQKLSFKYHPDRVINKGGTETEMATSQKLQTALNAARTVLKYLNTAFLADIGTDHKFLFYSKLNISSLCNEKEVKCRIYEMKFKLSMISRIKQQNIILQIQNFLDESKKCISTYLQHNIKEFKELSHSVLFYLNHCIKGFEKLTLELKEMEKQCKLKEDETMLSFVQNMIRDNKRDLMVLGQLEKTAKSSIRGNYNFFNTEEFIDPYFVCPFVWYINVILMCNVMVRNRSFWDKFKIPNLDYPKFNEFSELKRLYFLTEYYSGNECFKFAVMKILNIECSVEECFEMKVCNTEIKGKFLEILNDVNKIMEIKFNVIHYTEVMKADILALELEKCFSMMKEFEEKKQDLTQSIEKVLMKTFKMEENYDGIMRTSKDMNNEIEERLKANRKLHEKISSVFPDLL